MKLSWWKLSWWKLFGDWRVVYPDGKISMFMSYKVACDYAYIFSGVVRPSYEDPKRPSCEDPKE